MLNHRSLRRVLTLAWAHPLVSTYSIVAVCLILGGALLLCAWISEPTNFWPSASVEFGATLLTVGLTTLGVDRVIESRNRHFARKEWRSTRLFAVHAVRRQLQLVTFACARLITSHVSNKEVQLPTWNDLEFAAERDFQLIMQDVIVSLSVYQLEIGNYSEQTRLEQDVDHMLYWYRRNGDAFRDVGVRLLPFLIEAHCPQELLEAIAAFSTKTESMSWFLAGLDEARRKNQRLTMRLIECIDTVQALLREGEDLHKLAVAELGRTY